MGQMMNNTREKHPLDRWTFTASAATILILCVPLLLMPETAGEVINRAYDVITNKPRTEAYRGPGGIQAYFAMERIMCVCIALILPAIAIQPAAALGQQTDSIIG